MAWTQDSMNPEAAARAERRAKLLPAGTSTLAKSPFYPTGILGERYGVSAEGAYCTDLYGCRWLDMDMALGSVIWGHSEPSIVAGVVRQAALAFSLSMPSPIEGELAERILARLECFDQIQFAKSGSDVTTAAIRLARAVTGRRTVVLGRYHGWHDWSAFGHYGERATLGIPPETQKFTVWLERETAEDVAAALGQRDVAAIIVCPEHWTAPDLQRVRSMASQSGAILIFDEVKAGMRFGRRGVFGAKGTVPDLLCLGKGLANGLPLSALAGPRALMDHLPGTRFTGTHATDTLSMAAALAGERLLERTPQWPPWQESGLSVMTALDAAIARAKLGGQLAVHGYPGCFWLGDSRGDIPPTFRTHLLTCLADERVFSRGFVVPSAAHGGAEMQLVCDVIAAALTAWNPDGINSSGRSNPHPICNTAE
jgi:glutamate-1-semialdehyde 2,1-aminomutase